MVPSSDHNYQVSLIVYLTTTVCNIEALHGGFRERREWGQNSQGAVSKGQGAGSKRNLGSKEQFILLIDLKVPFNSGRK